MNRLAVTGIGIASPLGCDRETFWSALCAGRSGIGPITHFDAAAFPVQIAGEVRDLDAAAVRRRFPRVATVRDRKVWLGLAAADEAIADAGLSREETAEALLCVGVGLESFRLEDLARYAAAPDMAAAIARSVLADYDGWQLQTPLDTLACLLGERFELRAGHFTNCSACAAGAQVVGDAWQMLGEGSAEVALVGAADSMINPLGVGGFSLLRVLSEENDRPQRACRPFDATRQGTVLGEGAGFLVLEVPQRARARGAPVYAELIGYGSSLDGYSVTDPDPSGEGAVASMRRALAAGGVETGQVDCVSAHATGTPKNDAMETAAIKAVLGRRAREIPVHAVKSMTGHMIAASGVVEAAAAALTLFHRRVPPTINLVAADPNCDLDYVAGRSRPFAGRTVLSNSFGFGGQNATLLLAAAHDERATGDL